MAHLATIATDNRMATGYETRESRVVDVSFGHDLLLRRNPQPSGKTRFWLLFSRDNDHHSFEKRDIDAIGSHQKTPERLFIYCFSSVSGRWAFFFPYQINHSIVVDKEKRGCIMRDTSIIGLPIFYIPVYHHQLNP